MFSSVSELVASRVGEPDPQGFTGVKRTMSVRVGEYDLERIDLVAKELGISRQGFMNHIVSAGLNEAITAIQEAYSDDETEDRGMEFACALEEIHPEH